MKKPEEEEFGASPDAYQGRFMAWCAADVHRRGRGDRPGLVRVGIECETGELSIR